MILRTPDGSGKVALARYRSPSYEGDDGPVPANAPGIRHSLFVVDEIEASLAGVRAHGGELVNYENSYRLCYVRGPAGSSSSWRRRSADGCPLVRSRRQRTEGDAARRAC